MLISRWCQLLLLSLRSSTVVIAAIFISACGGGGGSGSSTGRDNSGAASAAQSSYALGGTVSGLAGTVTLQNNGRDSITVSANGSFRFTTPLAAGQGYRVTVASQPADQQCQVDAGEGAVASADISNVAVMCRTEKFTIGGAVSGLTGTLVLQNDGRDDLTLSANGNFFFSTSSAATSAYDVTVLTQPADQICSVASGSGLLAAADVTGVTVTCVAAYRLSGIISGLSGTIVLQNNGTDSLSLSTNGSFTFAVPLTTGSAYEITVLAQPINRRCTVALGNGTFDSSDIANVVVACAPTFTVGGTISGLIGAVVLTNGADELSINNDGSFIFSNALLSGSSYSVAVSGSSDPTQRCTVASGTGTVNSADITNVIVTCVGKSARYRPESYASFASQNGTANLEGTWVLLSEGTMSRGYQIAGVNPRRDYQLWSRTMVRIRRDPQNPAQYYVFTCGPGGARNDLRAFVAPTFFVPFYSSGTSIWTSYGMTIEDATTMRRNSVSRGYAFTGNTDGLVMGWNLSWVLKRISDDPFAAASSVTDNLSAHTEDASCIYESEGSYIATENDGTNETARVEGLFFWTDAYESHPTQLFNDASSYASVFSSKEEFNSHTSYQGADNNFTFRSTDAAQISITRSFSGSTSSHAVRGISADGVRSAEDTLQIPL